MSEWWRFKDFDKAIYLLIYFLSLCFLCPVLVNLSPEIIPKLLFATVVFSASCLFLFYLFFHAMAL